MTGEASSTSASPECWGTYVGAWLGAVASEVFQLVVFGFVLLIAAFSMLKRRNVAAEALIDPEAEIYRPPIPKSGRGRNDCRDRYRIRRRMAVDS